MRKRNGYSIGRHHTMNDNAKLGTFVLAGLTIVMFLAVILTFNF